MQFIALRAGARTYTRTHTRSRRIAQANRLIDADDRLICAGLRVSELNEQFRFCLATGAYHLHLLRRSLAFNSPLYLACVMCTLWQHKAVYTVKISIAAKLSFDY